LADLAVAQVLAKVDLVGVLAHGDDARFELHVLESSFVEPLDLGLGGRRRKGQGRDQSDQDAHGGSPYQLQSNWQSARGPALYSARALRSHTDSPTRADVSAVLNIVKTGPAVGRG